MAKKKKSEPTRSDAADLATWKKRIIAAEQFRDKERDEQGWTRFLDYYQGKYNLEKVQGGQNQVPVINLVFGHVRTEVAGIYFRNPYTCLNPHNAESVADARKLEADLNYRKQKMGVKGEVKRVLKDAYVVGHGWMLVGYCADLGSDEPEDQTDKAAEVSGYNQFVKKEEIFSVFLSWDEVVFDIAAKNPPYDCRWIAYSFIKPLSDVRESKSYKNTAGLGSNVSLKDTQTGPNKATGNNAGMEYDQPLVRLWCVFDLVNKQIKVLSLNHDQYLREDPYKLPFDCPLSMLAFNRINSKPYPLSDIYLIEPQILAKIKLRAQEMNHVKRWNRQLSIEAGSMKPGEKEKLSQGVDGAVTERMKGTLEPKPIQYAPMQNEIFALERLVDDDRAGVLGQTASERGQKSDSVTGTLGEEKLKNAGSQLSNEERLDVLEDFVEEVDGKIVALLQKYQNTETRVPMPGLKPEALASLGVAPESYDGHSIAYTPSETKKARFDLDVKAGSSVKMDKRTRDGIKMQMLEFGVKNGLFSAGGPVAQVLLRETMKDLELVAAEAALDEEAKMNAQKEQMQTALMLENAKADLAKKAAETDKQKARAVADLKKSDTGQMLATVEAMKAQAEAGLKDRQVSTEEKKVQLDAIHKAASLDVTGS